MHLGRAEEVPPGGPRARVDTLDAESEGRPPVIAGEDHEFVEDAGLLSAAGL